jgi:hypothetical protein
MSACAINPSHVYSAEIQIIGFYETLQGMISCVKNQPGTAIYSSEKLIMMVFPQGTKYGFIVLDRLGNPLYDLVKAGGNGQKVCPECMGEVINFLRMTTWRKILPAELPAQFLLTLQAYSTAAISVGSRALVSLIVIPVMPEILYPPSFQGIDT